MPYENDSLDLIKNLGNAEPISQGGESNLDLSSSQSMILNNISLDEQITNINSDSADIQNLIPNPLGDPINSSESNNSTQNQIQQMRQIQSLGCQPEINTIKKTSLNINQSKQQISLNDNQEAPTLFQQLQKVQQINGYKIQTNDKRSKSNFGSGFLFGFVLTIILMICFGICFKNQALNLVQNGFFVRDPLLNMYSSVAPTLNLPEISIQSSERTVSIDEELEENKLQEELSLDYKNEEKVQLNDNKEPTLTKAGSVEFANRVKTENCESLSCGDYTQIESSEIVLCSTFKEVESLTDDKPRIGNSGGCRYKDKSELYYLDLNS